MYIATVIGLMLVLPMASIAFGLFLQHHRVLDAQLVGKWFVFWAVGVRLLVAGIRQIVQPLYTSETILGLKGPDAMLIVRELGIANTAIGAAGLASIFFSGWIWPMAIIGTIFYGLAGINHVTQKHRSTFQIVAMASDLFAATVLVAICLAMTARCRSYPNLPMPR
jgi:hypothetical protein